MQIKCPECENAMSVGAIKPGRYQPKCKKCGRPFIVLVTDDQPPKIKVGKAAPETSRPASANKESIVGTSTKKVVTNTAAQDVDATLAVAQRTPVVTEQAAAPVAVRPIESAATVGVDATLDSEATSHESVERTQQKSRTVVRSGGSARSAEDADFSDSVVVPSRAEEQLPSGDVPERLGGYRILRLLGRGAMGAVYEAKQISLDRNVALKTIRGRLANNPAALARFTREAYAAAQLVHHNVVQIYDFGEDAGQHFFSMEWVRGGPLSDLIRDRGPLDPRIAATYVLQAARGLQFAHRHGMVHRDVKPANLLLNEEGVVKVADLGLVKIPDQPDAESAVGAASSASGMASGTQVTMMGTAVGTPAYMAPEQGMDATTVDHRADIYSLGCTLFFLLSGKAPFDGSQVSEVMRQHAQDPIPPIRAYNSRVPEPLARVIERSMEKRPESRYASLTDMIDDLESFLGVRSGQGFSPAPDQADRWESLAQSYASFPAAKLQRPMVLGACAAATLMLIGSMWLGFAYLLMAPALLFAGFSLPLILPGASQPSIVLRRIKTWLGSLGWSDYLLASFVSLVALLVVLLVGMLPGLLIGLLVGAIGGAAYHFLIAIPLAKSRAPVLAEAEKFIRDLRIKGIDEDTLREFTSRYAGKSWQPLCEAVFGYDAIVKMREQLQSDPVGKQIAGGRTLRDWICSSLDEKAQANKQAQDHRRLAKLEEQGLKSEGLSDTDAKERAWQMASAMIDATKLMPMSASAFDPKFEADQRRARMKAMLAEARSGKYAKKRDKLAPLRFALSGKMRLLAGCCLLGLFGMWAYQQQVFDTQAIVDAANSGTVDSQQLAVQAKGIWSKLSGQDLPPLLGFPGWSVGIAGLLLACSSFVTGWRMSMFAVPAAMVALLGPGFGIPAVGPVPAWVTAAAVSLVIMIPGVLWGESKRSPY